MQRNTNVHLLRRRQHCQYPADDMEQHGPHQTQLVHPLTCNCKRLQQHHHSEHITIHHSRDHGSTPQTWCSCTSTRQFAGSHWTHHWSHDNIHNHLSQKAPSSQLSSWCTFPLVPYVQSTFHYS